MIWSIRPAFCFSKFRKILEKFSSKFCRTIVFEAIVDHKLQADLCSLFMICIAIVLLSVIFRWLPK